MAAEKREYDRQKNDKGRSQAIISPLVEREMPSPSVESSPPSVSIPKTLDISDKISAAGSDHSKGLHHRQDIITDSLVDGHRSEHLLKSTENASAKIVAPLSDADTAITLSAENTPAVDSLGITLIEEGLQPEENNPASGKGELQKLQHPSEPEKILQAGQSHLQEN
jgi:hypothetical protein